MKLKLTSIICFVLAVAAGPLLSQNSQILEEIVNPFCMSVGQNTVCISDQYFIYFYSKDNLALKKKIGGKGEGPGFFINQPRIEFVGKRILASCPRHLITYSKSGELIGEKRTEGYSYHIDLVDDNYVMSDPGFGKGDGKFYISEFVIYNRDLEKIKVFDTHKTKAANLKEKKQRYLVMPCRKFDCYKGKIYYTNGKNGLHFNVLDANGNLVKSIQQVYEKVLIPESYKKRKFEEYKNIPGVKKFWERLKKINNYVFPKYFPPIQDFLVADDKIYIKTFIETEKGIEFLVMDLEGKMLGKCMLPDIKMNLCDIQGGIFYYLTEDDSEENWELHQTAVKY